MDSSRLLQFQSGSSICRKCLCDHPWNPKRWELMLKLRFLVLCLKLPRAYCSSQKTLPNRFERHWWQSDWVSWKWQCRIWRCKGIHPEVPFYCKPIKTFWMGSSWSSKVDHYLLWEASEFFLDSNIQSRECFRRSSTCISELRSRRDCF